MKNDYNKFLKIILSEKSYDTAKSMMYKEYPLNDEITKLLASYQAQELLNEWQILYPSFIKKQLTIQYKSRLSISTVCPVFYIDHEYVIGNCASEKEANELTGISDTPYTKRQAKFEEMLCNYLTVSGYVRILKRERSSMIPYAYIEGEQVSFHSLVFRNVLDIFSKDFVYRSK